jgi:hypothetical protein
MNKSELSGREFERILEKSGFTRPDYIKFLAEKHKIERTLSWAHWLIIHHQGDKKVPLKWVVLLKELVGEKDFEKWAKSGKGLGDRIEAVKEDSEAKEAADAIRSTSKKRPFGLAKGYKVGREAFNVPVFVEAEEEIG